MNKVATTRICPDYAPLPDLQEDDWQFKGLQDCELGTCLHWEIPRNLKSFREKSNDSPEYAVRFIHTEKDWPDLSYQRLDSTRVYEFWIDHTDDWGPPMPEEFAFFAPDQGWIPDLWERIHELTGTSQRQLLPWIIDFEKSDNQLKLELANYLKCRRPRDVKVKDARGYGSKTRQFRQALKHLAVLRLTEAYGLETAMSKGKGLLKKNPEQWRKARKSGLQMLNQWSRTPNMFL